MDAPATSLPTSDLSEASRQDWRSNILWLALLVTVPLLSVERFYAYNLLALIGFYAYLRLPAGSRPLSRDGLRAAFLCWLLVLLAQVFAKVPQHVAIVGLRDTLRGAFCFLLPFALLRSAVLPPLRTMAVVVLLLLLMLLVVHGYYVAQVGLNRAEISYVMDAYENRNLWAIAITATLLAGFALALSLPRRTGSLLTVLLVLAGSALHVLNPSRGAVVSTVLVVLLLLLARFDAARRRWVLAFFAGLLLFQLGYFGWLAGTAPGSHGELDLWSTWRLTIHRETLQGITAEPWFGYGLRSFSDVIGSRFVTLFGQHIDSPHNFLLDAAWTFGVPAALALLVISAAVLVPRFSLRLSTVPSFATLWSLALFGQLAVHGMQEGTLIRPYTLSALAVALALLVQPAPAADEGSGSV